MDSRYGVYWIFFVLRIATAVTHSSQTNPQPAEKYTSNSQLNFTITGNELGRDLSLSKRVEREAPPEYTIIKHTSRPSKRQPSYRTRRRPKPKPVYGPPNFSYGSPISDYTLGYSSQGKKTKNSATSLLSNSNFDTQYETDYAAPPLKTNLYSGHNSYESTFKASGNAYISPPSTALLPSLPIENYGSDATLSYTAPPLLESYSNQGYKNFGEPPPQLPKIHDLTGSGTHNIKSIPPSTNYGVPVAPIHQQNQPQNIQPSNSQHQDSYISNLYNSFSSPTTSQSQYYNKLPNLQPAYTNNGILSNAGIVGIGLNAAAEISHNSGNLNSGNVNSGNFNSATFNSGPYNSGPYNSGKFNPGTINAGISSSDTKFNQDALNTLTYHTYATAKPPQVNYVPASVTISSSKEITVNRNPSSGKFAEPPANYANSYRTPVTSYDVPIQHDASKTSYNVDSPENQFHPTIYKSPHNSWTQSRSPSTTTEAHRYLPPTLPTAYDQNQFNSFSRERDYSSNYNQETDFLDADGDYGSLFEVPHESKKIPKTKLTKTYGGTNLKSEDSSIESVEVPSDEYVDELINAPTTKKPRTRRRRTRPTVQSTTPHILDTEDLRDAFSSGTVQYSLAVKPNEKSSKNKAKSKVAEDKNFVLLSSANTNRNWSRQYPKRQESSFDPINDVKEFLHSDSSGKSNSSSKNGIEILSIQKSKSHSYYAGTVAPPRSFKEKGISARYDQPKYDDSMFNVVSTNVRMASKSNSKLAASVTGYRRTKKQNFEESKEKEVKDDAGSKDIDPIFWNGHILPDNHKLAKRIA